MLLKMYKVSETIIDGRSDHYSDSCDLPSPRVPVMYPLCNIICSYSVSSNDDCQHFNIRSHRMVAQRRLISDGT
jgi:hypothetical protein